MAKAVENYLPVDRDPEQAELSQDRNQPRPTETQKLSLVATLCPRYPADKKAGDE